MTTAQADILSALANSRTDVGTAWVFERIGSLTTEQRRHAMHRSQQLRHLVQTEAPQSQNHQTVVEDLLTMWQRRDHVVAVLENEVNERHLALSTKLRDRIEDEIICEVLSEPHRFLALEEELGEDFLAEVAWQVSEATFYGESFGQQLLPLWKHADCTRLNTNARLSLRKHHDNGGKAILGLAKAAQRTSLASPRRLAPVASECV